MNSLPFFRFSDQEPLTVPDHFTLEGWEGKTFYLRPYQCEAAEKVLQSASRISSRFALPAVVPGGIVQFAPGTGKTLTAFRTAQLVSRRPHVNKVFFLVDRNALDWQMVRNFARCKNSFIDLNLGIEKLLPAIYNPEIFLIPTTLQKFEVFLHSLRDFESIKKHSVFIYDDCESALTADRKALISRVFPNSQHYLFTSSAISEYARGFFGEELFSYTLSQALEDRNVLPFQIEYDLNQNVRTKCGFQDVDELNESRAMLSPTRIRMIVRKIFRKLGEKTEDRRFGSILAVNDELSAMNYYVEMLRQIRKTGRDLRIAAVYDSTPKTRKAVVDRRRRDFWELVAEDYNAQFGTSFSAIGDRFQEYILDVSRRLALGQIDLLLVVNPYLTSFTTANLNTLWLDCDLAPESLLPAFSRINRRNAHKKTGNVVCFRDLRRVVNEVFPPEALEKP
ncbi:MAG: DEAD/DEAH box helicase family protein [Thermoguttaceae bacterium]|nr:DEAD/DEAH box helicase family protein [Thermoguttaceae bacterium]